MLNFREIYGANQFPIFQNRMYGCKEDALNCAKGDIWLVEDLKTGLIYNKTFCKELMQYDEHYQNEQSFSPFFQGHLIKVSKIVERSLGKKAIIEIGCGKGYFLELLSMKGFEIVGFDPSYEGKNPNIIKQYYNSDFGKKSKGIILRHVLEHIYDPFSFLEKIKKDNNNCGKIYIEVPCFDWICKNKAWFDIFYEHVNYFRLSDLLNMFDKVFESGYLFGGQYMYIIADIASLKQPSYNEDNRVKFPKDYLSSLYSIKNESSVTVVWGGASKGVIFCLLLERSGKKVDVVIDINPSKQGKYLPATGIQVKSPNDVLKDLPIGSDIYVMNTNYLKEIGEMSGYAYKYITV